MENKKSFYERLKELNVLVSKLQEDIPFEESLEIYNKCKVLSEELKKELDETITKISLVNESNEKEDF